MLDEDDRIASLEALQAGDDPQGFVVARPRQGLVEEEQLRFGGERNGEFQLALFAVREQAGRHLSTGRQAGERKSLGRRLVERGLRRRIAEEAEARSGPRLNREGDILESREARQDGGDLERARKAAAH